MRETETKIEVVNVPIASLKPATYNPRKFTESEYNDLKESISRFGVIDPIIVNHAQGRENIVIGGHFRLRVAKDLGYKAIPVVFLNIPDLKKERELNLRLNKNLGNWDFDFLKDFDEDVLKDVGFDSAELDDIFKIESSPKDDDIPEPKQTNVKIGDVFKLGEHRLMCGDAAKRDDVEKLMQDDKADMVFTDPPYGIDYGKKNRFLNSFQPSGRNLKDIANDTIGKDELFKMLVSAFSLAREYGHDHCSFYVTAPQGGELTLMMMMMMIASELPTRHVLIWKKNTQNFSLGRLDYEYKHEPILFAWKKNHKFYGCGEHKSSVWEIPKPTKSELHPTMKPVALIENALLNSSQRGEICLDLFGGSGSTLIACEKTNRKCRMMELDPVYCQVIVERWEQFSGKKAVQINEQSEIKSKAA